MLTNKYTRTTISVPENLLFEIKKKALLEKKTVKDIFIDGLKLVLKYKYEEPEISRLSSLFGAWGEGEKGSDFLKKTRETSFDNKRENYINNIWKKF